MALFDIPKEQKKSVYTAKVQIPQYIPSEQKPPITGLVNTAKYKPDTAPDQLNYRESFVSYVLDNYLFKHFWVDKNPCETDIPLSCFYDDRVNVVERWAANIMNNILFASIPIAL